MNVNEEANSSNLNSVNYGYEPIAGTPFHIVSAKEGWFIAMGNYRMTQSVESRDECMSKLHLEQYNIIANMFAAGISTMEKYFQTIK